MNNKSLKQELDWSILLHDIRSVQNVASIFRLAEVFGVNKIYLSGVTPGPLDRFGREREDFLKISLGAEKSVGFERLEEELGPINFINKFKSEEGSVLALEQNENSVDYRDFNVEKEKRYLLVPGREREGLDQDILNACDLVLEIPQYGKKESLNIFSATSILVARLFG